MTDGARTREATPADRPAVRALQLAAIAEPAPRLLDLALTGPGRVLVREVPTPDGPTVIGYALAVPGDGGADVAAVYVAELAVADGHRRAGHGTALLDAVAARLPRYDELRLTARAGDEAALSFYREAGFRREATLADHFDEDDGVLLARDLSGAAEN